MSCTLDAGTRQGRQNIDRKVRDALSDYGFPIGVNQGIINTIVARQMWSDDPVMDTLHEVLDETREALQEMEP